MSCSLCTTAPSLQGVCTQAKSHVPFLSMLLYVFVNSMSVKRTISRERLTGQICLVPVWRFPSPSRSIHFGDVPKECPFSPPEPVVSSSRGSLQIKCGSGDENGKCLDKHRMRMRALFYEIRDYDVVTSTSSETQGANSGGEGKSKRAGKKSGAKKSKGRGEEPLGTMFYQTGSEWSQLFWLLIGARKTFVFFCQSEGSRTWSRFVCSYTQSTWSSAVRYVYLGCSRRLYTRGE